MLIDAQSLPPGHEIETDICIIGAGPAGLTLAQALGGDRRQVALLESGAQAPDPAVQSLAISEDSSKSPGSHPYPQLRWLRNRQLGGTAAMWHIDLGQRGEGVRYVPFDPIDFEQKDWVPDSGWPFGKAELDPYYERAQQLCQIAPYAYGPGDWEEESAPQFAFERGEVVTKMFQCGPRDVFLKELPERLAQSPNVTIYTNATAVELETDDQAQAVTQVQVATLGSESCGRLGGNRFCLRAKVVILAQGGLETARLLLLSDGVQQGGLGNGQDLVGRYLMDHQMVRAGSLYPSSPEIFKRMALYDLRPVRGTSVIGKFVLDEAVQRREKLLNIATALFPRHGFYNSTLLRRLLPRGRNHLSPAVESLRLWGEALRQKRLPDRPLVRLGEVVTGWDDILYYKSLRDPLYQHPANFSGFDRGGWSAQPDPDKRFGLFDLVQMTEQAPHAENRITLGDERDALGCRRLRVHWRWNELDIQSVFRTQAILQRAFAEAELGRLELLRDQDWPAQIQPSIHHHMGTTKMNLSPRRGVVDAQCRVHGVANLYIASSSVFPTGGYANPTLTIVAIALRVADRVKAELASEPMVQPVS